MTEMIEKSREKSGALLFLSRRLRGGFFSGRFIGCRLFGRGLVGNRFFLGGLLGSSFIGHGFFGCSFLSGRLFGGCFLFGGRAASSGCFGFLQLLLKVG